MVEVAVLRADGAHIAGQRISQRLLGQAAKNPVLMESLQHHLHRHSHLFRIKDRLQDLLFESCDASVPELRFTKSAPQKRWRMPFPALAEHANAQLPRIRKRMGGIMAACAGDPSVLREASVEEQALPQRHLLRV